MSWHLPPWDQLTFTFGFDPYQTPIKQCASLPFTYSLSLGTDGAATANPPPTPPYELLLYRGGSQPLVVPINNTGVHGGFQWVNNLAVGPSYTMAMRDSLGYSGGIVFIFTVSPGSGCSLNPDPMKPNTLDVAVTGNAQCGEANIVVDNGIGPYKLELVPGDLQPRTLYFATNEFSLTLDMKEATAYFIVITDSVGNSATSGLFNVAGSADSSCLNQAQTVTIGMFSTLYSGSGVVAPTLTTTGVVQSSATTTSIRATSSSTETSTAQSLNASHKSASALTIGLAASISCAVLLLLALCILIIWRRRKQKRQDGSPPGENILPSTQPQTPMKAEGAYDPMTMNPYYNTAPGGHNHGAPLMTVHEYEAAASIQRQYPTYAVPEIQSEMPRNIAGQESPDAGWRNSQTSSADGSLRDNSIFAPIPRQSAAVASQSESARTSMYKSPQDTTFSQNSGQPPQSAPPDSVTPSSAALPATSWFERGVSPGRAALSPPPRVGTAATSTSSVPPQYAEHWAQSQYAGSIMPQDKK